MNDMTITRKASDVELAAEVRREADGHEPIVTRDGYTVFDPAAWEGLVETLRILSNPANADDLRAAIAELDAGQFEEHELADE
jgi:antitoxin YefM